MRFDTEEHLPRLFFTETGLAILAAAHNLGLALWRLGERESGTARLGEAIRSLTVVSAAWLTVKNQRS